MSRVGIFLDSGAFSAWRKAEDLDLKKYIEFIKVCAPALCTYACLDAIPGGARGGSVEKSAAASYKNQQIMRDAGLHPIPIFHQGECFTWLEKYLAAGEPYIGLSPNFRAAKAADSSAWLDDCFTLLTDGAGKPTVKTHGFGATGHKVIMRYPWHSVDSATWAISPAYGRITIPAMGVRVGDFDFTRSMGVSTKPELGNDVRCRHLSRFSALELQHIEAFLAACGLSLEDIKLSFDARCVAFAYFLSRVPAPSMFGYRRGFFTAVSTKAPTSFDFRLFFATQLRNVKRNLTLSAVPAEWRLLSYFELRAESPALLERYAICGALG